MMSYPLARFAAAFALLASLASLVTGCAEGPRESAPPSVDDPPSRTESHTESASPRARRWIVPPTGFQASSRGAWSLLASADGASHVVEGPIEADAKLSAAIAEAASVLGAGSIELADEQTITIGADNLPALAADGRCQWEGREMRIAGAAVDGGDGQRLLVVHVSALDVSEETQRAALGAIGALRHP